MSAVRKKGSSMTNETNTATATAAKKTIKAGKTETMKATPKKPAPKKATKTPVANGVLSKDKTIKVLKTDHEFRGNRGERMNILLKLNGKTVQNFRDALSKRKLGGPEYGDYVGSSLRLAIEAGLVSVK